MSLVQNPSVMVQVTLDKSQAAGPAERGILSSDEAGDAQGFANDFAIGESSTHQISHTKGGVLDGIVAFEGSTNWSSSGEGTGINLAAEQQVPGFRAQKNTFTVYVNLYEIAKFSARLDYEHAVAAAQSQDAPWRPGRPGRPGRLSRSGTSAGAASGRNPASAIQHGNEPDPIA